MKNDQTFFKLAVVMTLLIFDENQQIAYCEL